MTNEELEKRIEFLEKQMLSVSQKRDREIAIMPRFQVCGDMNVPVWFCPCCEKELRVGNCDNNKPNYCENCGQKIDWNNSR